MIMEYNFGTHAHGVIHVAQNKCSPARNHMQSTFYGACRLCSYAAALNMRWCMCWILWVCTACKSLLLLDLQAVAFENDSQLLLCVRFARLKIYWFYLCDSRKERRTTAATLCSCVIFSLRIPLYKYIGNVESTCKVVLDHAVSWEQHLSTCFTRHTQDATTLTSVCALD